MGIVCRVAHWCFLRLALPPLALPAGRRTLVVAELAETCRKALFLDEEEKLDDAGVRACDRTPSRLGQRR